MVYHLMLHSRCSIAIGFSTNMAVQKVNRMNRHRHVRPLLAMLAVAGACAVSLPGQAAEVAGVALEDATTLAGQPLVLNGLGLRSKMFIKVYVVGLYLPRRETRPGDVLSMPGAKRVQLVMMRNVGSELLADNLSKGLAENTSKAELAQLQGRVDQLKSTMTSLGEARKGSKILLDFQPGVGTHVTVDGKAVGNDIPGDDFYRALLRIWIGDEVASKPLKAELLGLPPA